ncbi:hypothetical protein [Luedemannella helvata]|uniref:Uncharacterized protein n=1 Tax=Luedemannella helvata TaxID=349315 RepID=A0ABN2JP25_9ACTN
MSRDNATPQSGWSSTTRLRLIGAIVPVLNAARLVTFSDHSTLFQAQVVVTIVAAVMGALLWVVSLVDPPKHWLTTATYAAIGFNAVAQVWFVVTIARQTTGTLGVPVLFSLLLQLGLAVYAARSLTEHTKGPRGPKAR